ncbi:hypothetical protein ABZ883_39555 [Streptomyces sp. NPDC046977]|uniref:hypothetical protein n=1 Tax=Streptomyces sp. NPDC046977 TaxID=3154703 RepID=UPI0033DBA5F3
MAGGAREELAGVVDRLDVLLSDLAEAEPMAVLRAIGRLEALIGRQAPPAGVAARGQGATWEEIGAAVNATRQAAHQRWARHLPRGAGADPGDVVG